MNIGLLDIDGHNFPNLALMKIAGWHKAHGDDVDWALPFEHYDLLYRSKIFTFSPDDNTQYFANQTIGGVLVTTSKAGSRRKSTDGPGRTTRSTRSTGSRSSSTPVAASGTARSAWYTTRKDLSIPSSRWS